MSAIPTVSATDSTPEKLAVDAVVVGVHSGKSPTKTASAKVELGPGAAAIDVALGGELATVLQQLGASGATGEVTKVATLGATKAPVVVAIGLGKFDAELSPEAARRAAGSAISALRGTAKVGMALAVDDSELIRGVAEGVLLSAYDFIAHKSELPAGYKGPVRSVSLVVAKPALKEARAQIKHAAILAESAYQTRDWVNTAPNQLRPPAFAEQASKAAKAKGLSVQVLDEKALVKGGYGGIMAVGGGSEAKPRLVRLHYTPSKRAKTTIALVGKGITFDSGGISIKPAQGMWDMKSDMAGAAAVIAAMLAIAELKPAVEVIGYAPMAENMPSGSAYRPGDVVTMYGGKTIEILNTDAEGRIVLGDAISRANADKPDYILETSTLTGGQVTALGNRVAGVMGTPELTDRVKAAGEVTGEPMWPMPLPDEVRASMESPIADFGQISAGMDRSAHMLQGGVFLHEMIDDGISWAHIDIAGPSNSSSGYGYISKGGTGVPMRTLVELVEDIARNG